MTLINDRIQMTVKLEFCGMTLDYEWLCFSCEETWPILALPARTLFLLTCLSARSISASSAKS